MSNLIAGPWVTCNGTIPPYPSDTTCDIRNKDGKKTYRHYVRFWNWVYMGEDIEYRVWGNSEQMGFWYPDIYAKVHIGVNAPPPQHPKAPVLLSAAASHMAARAATYDTPEGERSMGKAVAAWNAITGHDIKESEGWLLLQILKDVRLFTREDYHADSAEDCIAYAALKAEARGAGK